MFKFNFQDKNDKKEDNIKDCDPKTEEKSWIESEEIIPKNQGDIVKKILANCSHNSMQYNEILLKYYTTEDVLNVLRNNIVEKPVLNNSLSVINADQSHSDLISSVYEGGLKIWECTYDLLNYIDQQKINFKDKSVLDLGCGTGLIGIMSLIAGAYSCTFQDYNPEILKYNTIPNVILNEGEYTNKSRFYSGDWSSFTDLLSSAQEKFNYIFTSETIYNVENYEKLHNTFQKLLKEDGIVYLAAKSYYFGVGGGISLFTDFLKKKNVFKYELCWNCPEGLKREILKIQFIEFCY
ncbi:histidine protein methyltransferase 1 homolog isoform X1 [Euwallacea fornicatus]|uniref:histidine protein methyltransferase 1 homolog isoform X1 n=1 Tax=Euwallacea fornicatus TaxID=995702 RepID=UPI003390101F